MQKGWFYCYHQLLVWEAMWRHLCGSMILSSMYEYRNLFHNSWFAYLITFSAFVRDKIYVLWLNYEWHCFSKLLGRSFCQFPKNFSIDHVWTDHLLSLCALLCPYWVFVEINLTKCINLKVGLTCGRKFGFPMAVHWAWVLPLFLDVCNDISIISFILIVLWLNKKKERSVISQP